VRGSVSLNTDAWERFTEHGPVALLPMAQGRYGSVMTVPRNGVEAIAALSDQDYLACFQQRFGWRAGRFLRAGKRSAYPMRMRVAERLTAARFALLGNAAQTLHPIGAQGFNLGLRDALWMAQLLSDQRAGDVEADPGDAGLLQRYAAARAQDRQRTLDFSDGMARLFVRQAATVRASGMASAFIAFRRAEPARAIQRGEATLGDAGHGAGGPTSRDSSGAVR